MSSTFDKKLKELLNNDQDNQAKTEELVNSLPEDQQEQVPEEMLPVEYDSKETSLELGNKDLQSDYEYARSNMYGLIGRSNAALELTLKIALMSEHPRALEVAANLIKTSSDISKELISLHKAIEEKNNKQPPNGSYTQVNNNYYSKKDEAKDVEDQLDGLPDENV